MQNKIAIPIIIILSIVLLGLILFINNKDCKSYQDIAEQLIEEHNLIQDKSNCIPYMNKTIDIMIPELYTIENSQKLNDLTIYNHENKTIKAIATISSKSDNVDCLFEETQFTKSSEYDIRPNEYRKLKLRIYTKSFINQKQFCEVTVNMDKKKEKIKFDIVVGRDISKNRYFCLF